MPACGRWLWRSCRDRTERPRRRAHGPVHKVASGAADTVPYISVTNLARTLRELKQRGISVIGAAADAESDLDSTRLDGPLAWVLGGEGKGMRRLRAIPVMDLFPFPCWAAWKVLMFLSAPVFSV